MSLQTKVIGRQPTDHGPYDPELAYGKKFQCTLFGCAWESLHDNNNTAPAVWDGGDTITPNLVDWKKVSGSYEAWLMNHDKPATSEQYPFNGMGRIRLQKNIVNGVNTLTQAMLTQQNTIYVIQYDFTIGEDVTVPADCVLEFKGGSISGDGTNKDTITGNATGVIWDGSSTIFNNIILDGTFSDNFVVDAIMFGVKTTSSMSSTYATSNTSILLNYVIPSAENIVKKVHFPNGGYFAINQPISFSGKYDVEIEGTIGYYGSLETTAITIGRYDEGYTIRKNFYINHIEGADGRLNSIVDYSGSIPEDYAVRFVNLKECTITINYIHLFVYGMELLGSGRSSSTNSIYLGSTTAATYCSVIVRSEKRGNVEGWANENTFYKGTLIADHDYGIGIILKGDGVNHINNNVFYKPNLETSHVGVSFDHAWENCIYDARMEEVDVPMEVKSGTAHKNKYPRNANNIVTTLEWGGNAEEVASNGIDGNVFMYTQDLCAGNFLPSANLKPVHTDGFAVFQYQTQNAFDATLSTAIKASDNSVGHVRQSIYQSLVPSANNDSYLIGFVVDLSVAQTYRIESTKKTSKFVAGVLDSNNDFIDIYEHFDDYIDSLSEVEKPSSSSVVIMPTQSVNSFTVKYKKVSALAFVGVSLKADIDDLRLLSNCLGNPIRYPYPICQLDYTPNGVYTRTLDFKRENLHYINTSSNKVIFAKYTGIVNDKEQYEWYDAAGNLQNPT